VRKKNPKPKLSQPKKAARKPASGASESKRCAFCGRSGRLSGEHFFPKWAHPEVPMQRGPRASYSIIAESGGGGGAAYEEEGRRRKNGDVAQTVMRVVCDTCNNEWMSRIETAAQHLLLRLMRGERCRLSRDERIVVTTWIVLKFFVADAIENSAAFDDGHRGAFMTSGTVPPSVRVWLGYLETSQISRLDRKQGTFTNGAIDARPPDRGNTESLAFNLGRLFVFVLLDRAQVINLADDPGKKLVPLWPEPPASRLAALLPWLAGSYDLSWPPDSHLTGAESVRLGRTLVDAARSAPHWRDMSPRTRGL